MRSSPIFMFTKQTVDDVDLCEGHSNASVKTQIRHGILIGVQEETKQLLELKSDATLEEVSHEAAESTTQELRPLHSPTLAVSTYRQKRRASRGMVKKSTAEPSVALPNLHDPN